MLYNTLENTLPAFELAANYDIYSLESDLQFSLDGVPFMMHDINLRRTTNVRDVFPERAACKYLRICLNG